MNMGESCNKIVDAMEKIQYLKEEKDGLIKSAAQINEQIKSAEEQIKSSYKLKNSLVSGFAKNLAMNFGNNLFRNERKPFEAPHDNYYRLCGNGYSILAYPNGCEQPKGSPEIQLVDDEKSEGRMCMCFVPSYNEKKVICSAEIDLHKGAEELSNIYAKFEQVLNKYDFNKGEISNHALELISEPLKILHEE